jgi:hypothetical protein
MPDLYVEYEVHQPDGTIEEFKERKSCYSYQEGETLDIIPDHEGDVVFEYQHKDCRYKLWSGTFGTDEDGMIDVTRNIIGMCRNGREYFCSVDEDWDKHRPEPLEGENKKTRIIYEDTETGEKIDRTE